MPHLRSSLRSSDICNERECVMLRAELRGESVWSARGGCLEAFAPSLVDRQGKLGLRARSHALPRDVHALKLDANISTELFIITETGKSSLSARTSLRRRTVAHYPSLPLSLIASGSGPEATTTLQRCSPSRQCLRRSSTGRNYQHCRVSARRPTRIVCSATYLRTMGRVFFLPTQSCSRVFVSCPAATLRERSCSAHCYISPKDPRAEWYGDIRSGRRRRQQTGLV